MATSMRIVNVTRGGSVCDRVLVADGPLLRLRGLLGRDDLPEGEGLLLTPAPGIHTAFMRFAIDAVFLDKDLRVLRIVAALRPWRTASRRRARAVLELAAGEAARVGVELGDELALAEIVASNDNGADAAQAGATDAALGETDAGQAKTDAGRANGTARARRLAAVDAKRAERTQSSADEAAAPAPHENRNALEPDELNLDGHVRIPPIGVLLITPDRRFREVISLLLTRRGCNVFVDSSARGLAERVRTDEIQVVLIDAGRSLTAAARTAAAVEALSSPVGFVIVGNEADNSLFHLQIVPKWGEFDVLFGAVARAYRERGRPHLLVSREDVPL